MNVSSVPADLRQPTHMLNIENIWAPGLTRTKTVQYHYLLAEVTTQEGFYPVTSDQKLEMFAKKNRKTCAYP